MNKLIHVTQKDIDEGCKVEGTSCMVARALKRAYPNAQSIYASYGSHTGLGGAFARIGKKYFTMSIACAKRMSDWDDGKTVKPFAFRLKPR